MKTEKQIRQLISKVYWDLKRDINKDIDTKDIYFDVGYLSSLCVAIDKINLGQKIHDQFVLD